MGVIEHVCKSRKQMASSPTPVAGSTGVYVPYPIEVTVGGATILHAERKVSEGGRPMG